MKENTLNIRILKEQGTNSVKVINTETGEEVPRALEVSVNFIVGRAPCCELTVEPEECELVGEFEVFSTRNYEKWWNDLRAVLAELQKASPVGVDGAAATMIKLMDQLEKGQKNGTTTKEVN